MSCKVKSSYQKPVSFINEDNSCTAVYNNLLGTAFANNNLVVLENHKILLRRDHRSMTGKVKILAGGGAGLEPAETGCIGQGMLTGAVFGEMFAAPSSYSILIAIRELAYEHPDGILLLVKNYLGDKLNFGLALEKAMGENITIKMLLIGDDSGNPEPQKCGRRGLAGSVLVYKIAGAMAEEGKSLDDIFNACRESVLTDLSTISVCLSPSSSMKWQKVKSTETEEIVLGIGAYGQPGIKIKYNNLSETVCTMLNTVTNSSSESSITNDDAPVVVLVNNLGATSKLEESVVCTDIVNELLLRNFTIVRFFSGTFMSLLDTKGFSVTLLKIRDPETLRFIDAPTSAFNWPKSNLAATDKITYTQNMKNFNLSSDSSITVKPTLNHQEFENLAHANIPLGPALLESSKSIQQILVFASEALISCEKQINIIDLEVGDGDAGTALRNGAVAIKEALEEGQINLTHPCKLLRDLAKIVDRYIGGTTGALYNTFLSSASQVFQNSTDVSLKVWFEAFKSGVKALKYYGGAEIGERTLLDVLCPAIEAFRLAVEKDEDIHRTASNIACTCEYYAEETKKIKPFYVRGNYPTTNLIYPDAGAHAVSVWIRAVTFEPDRPVRNPGMFDGQFLSEDEAKFILKLNTSKNEIMQFFDDKLGEDNIQQILLFDTAMYCRRNYGNKAKKTSSLINIMHYSHLYFTASRWRTPDETYTYFKERLLRHSMEYPPSSMGIFEPEEAREALLFFIEVYIRNLPLTRLVCLPHYKLRLKIKNGTEISTGTK